MLNNSPLVSHRITGHSHSSFTGSVAKPRNNATKVEFRPKDQVSFSGSGESSSKGQGKTSGKGKRQHAIEKLNNWLHPKPMNVKLIEAAQSGQAKELEKLLNKTHQVYVKDWMGNTLLHHAAFSGDPDTVFLLLCRHLNPYSRNNYGQTPIDFSATDEIKRIFRNDGCHETRRQGSDSQQEQTEAEELTSRGIQPPNFNDYF